MTFQSNYYQPPKRRRNYIRDFLWTTRGYSTIRTTTFRVDRIALIIACIALILSIIILWKSI